MSDNKTTFEEIKRRLAEFRDKRDWAQFHDPKNLAEAISIEAAELQELFLWKDKEKVIAEIKIDPQFKEKVSDELADILCFCFNLANSSGIDISDSVIKKIEKNDKKYPPEKAKGTANKYNQL